MNQINQINKTNQTNQIDQPDQNRAERPMPTLVFLLELDSELSLRLERLHPAESLYGFLGAAR